jgi:hypothetical protein
MKTRNTRNVVGSTLLLFSTCFVVATCSHEPSPGVELSATNSTSFSPQGPLLPQDVGPDELYFDCLADNPVECEEFEVFEERGCRSHQVCVDHCLQEEADPPCYLDCNIAYLGVESSRYDIGACFCDVCAEVCDERCDCAELL